jgi:parvulin-like peptidyl-prolyl isomerase
MDHNITVDSSGDTLSHYLIRHLFLFMAHVSIFLFIAIAGCRSAQVVPDVDVPPVLPEAVDATEGPAAQDLVVEEVEPTAEVVPLAARINGESITVDGLKKQFDLYFTLSDTSEVYRQSVSLSAFLERYLLEVLLFQEARKEGVVQVSPEEIDEELANYLQQTGLTLEALEDNLIRAGLDMADGRRFLENNRIIDDWSRRKFGEGIVTDQEVRAYYDDNPDYFRVPESVVASQILICHQESPSCESGLTKEAARALIQRIRDMATPENFAALAEEYSTDPSASKGGRIGSVFKGYSLSAFEKAAFSLAEGEISDVVETASGYHIILVTEKRDASETPFESVREVIREDMLTARIQTAVLGYAMQLKAGARIELFDFETGEASAATEALETGETPDGVSRNDSPFPTFQETDLDICLDDDGRPLILLFSAASCSHCEWVGGVFDAVVQAYMDRGLIEAHHYDMESGDDLLTEAVEDEIPKDHLAIGKTGDPDLYLPYFNFGCRYDRIGTGYEEQDDLAAEAEEMCRVIEALVE